MKYLLTLTVAAVFGIHSANAAIYTNGPDADAFVRAAAPTSNYGAAGALSVSGATATNNLGTTNGIFDTFIRFNTGAMVSNFNTLFGTNNWVINGATLQVTETNTPNNNIFNRGVGSFQIQWLTNGNWTEGTGMPNLPTTDGISYDSETNLLNPATDLNLGAFTNSGMTRQLNFSLALPSAFVSNLQAGGEVGLYMTAISSNIGFTFNSRHFGTASARPYLNVSAVPQPGISGVSMSGPDVMLNCANGAAGETYYVLAATNAASQPDQWSPIATNVPGASGNFTVTLTNAAGSQQMFFILVTH